MSYKDIMHFLIAVEEIDEPGMVVFELERLLASYKLAHYSIFTRPVPFDKLDSIVLASKWPDGWVDTYLAQKYITCDPTIRHLLRAWQPYRWAEALETFRDSNLFVRMVDMQATASRFGLSEGAVFPVHGRHGLLGGLTTGGPECDFSPAEMALLSVVANRAWWKLAELQGRAPVAHAGEIDPSKLTPRGLQAVSLLAEGKTSAEIAAILGVSIHTVDWHFNSIQQKLGARNRYQTLALCLRHGLTS